MMMARPFVLSWLVALAVALALLGLFVYVMVLIVKALRKYIKGEPAREKARQVRSSLAEELREHRTRCKMTQEFVAEALGVSRQAVSKWESGASDPSTANLLALAKLYGVSAQELLEDLEG